MNGMAGQFDVAIIGAGIAGASLAAECAPHARVLLVEASYLSRSAVRSNI